jgi:hypothetical protein
VPQTFVLPLLEWWSVALQLLTTIVGTAWQEGVPLPSYNDGETARAVEVLDCVIFFPHFARPFCVDC